MSIYNIHDGTRRSKEAGRGGVGRLGGLKSLFGGGLIWFGDFISPILYEKLVASKCIFYLYLFCNTVTSF